MVAMVCQTLVTGNPWKQLSEHLHTTLPESAVAIAVTGVGKARPTKPQSHFQQPSFNIQAKWMFKGVCVRTSLSVDHKTLRATSVCADSHAVGLEVCQSCAQVCNRIMPLFSKPLTAQTWYKPYSPVAYKRRGGILYHSKAFTCCSQPGCFFSFKLSQNVTTKALIIIWCHMKNGNVIISLKKQGTTLLHISCNYTIASHVFLLRYLLLIENLARDLLVAWAACFSTKTKQNIGKSYHEMLRSPRVLKRFYQSSQLLCVENGMLSDSCLDCAGRYEVRWTRQTSTILTENYVACRQLLLHNVIVF